MFHDLPIPVLKSGIKLSLYCIKRQSLTIKWRQNYLQLRVISSLHCLSLIRFYVIVFPRKSIKLSRSLWVVCHYKQIMNWINNGLQSPTTYRCLSIQISVFYIIIQINTWEKYENWYVEQFCKCYDTNPNCWSKQCFLFILWDNKMYFLKAWRKNSKWTKLEEK